MFTGLIEEIGKVKGVRIGSKSGQIEISAYKVLEGASIGDSIAVNGVCLTITTMGNTSFTADVMAETFRRSSLGSLVSGAYVNLERAMAAGGRFGGHIVSGHIDGTGTVADIKREDNAIWYTINADRGLLKYIVTKGSIAIDGISLTVAYVDDKCFKVSIIPHTSSQTILQYKKTGNIVNLECDMIGKYVEKLLSIGAVNLAFNDTVTGTAGQKASKEGGITMEFLAENGF